MNIELLKIAFDDFLTSVYPKYVKIFPLNERKTIRDFRFCVKRGTIDFYEVMVDGENVGFAVILKADNNPYVVLDYLAIYEKYRNKGYGSAVIVELKKHYAGYRGIVVEIEKPHDTDTNRRAKFYERLGFRLVNVEIEMWGVRYHPYLLQIDGEIIDDGRLVGAMFQLYDKVFGTMRTKRFCKIIKNEL